MCRKFECHKDIHYKTQLHGPGLGLIMYIFTTLEFPTHNIDFHTVHTRRLITLNSMTATFSAVVSVMYVKRYLITLASTTKADFNEERHTV